jgi:hypothetical protein
MRAQATAVGLVQISIELRRAGLLDQEAFDRVERAIADYISQGRSRSVKRAEFEADVRDRLDRISAGTETVGKLSTRNE